MELLSRLSIGVGCLVVPGTSAILCLRRFRGLEGAIGTSSPREMGEQQMNEIYLEVLIVIHSRSARVVVSMLEVPRVTSLQPFWYRVYLVPGTR